LSKPIIGGPHFSNFPDIGSALVKAGVFRVLKSQEELLRISYELSLLRNYELIADEKNAVFSRSGAIECIIGQIEEFIN
jgi:3-deoxy-D-manno-octulosonic-acid transferase